MNLSEAAKRALINTASRQGAKIPADVDYGTYVEIRDAALVTKGGCLTRNGTVARMKAVREAENAAFGE